MSGYRPGPVDLPEEATAVAADVTSWQHAAERLVARAEGLRSLIERARLALRHGRLDEVGLALEPYLTSGTARRESVTPWLQAVVFALAGRAATELGREERGRDLLERSRQILGTTRPTSAEIDPKDVADLACALRLLGQPAEALTLIRHAPDESTCHSWRVRLEEASSLVLVGRYQEALAEFDAALDDKPDDPFILEERAGCHERLGHEAQAVRDATAAAVAFLVRERLDAALKAFDRAQQLAPEDASVQTLRAELLLRQGRPVDALAAAEEAARRASDSLWADTIRVQALVLLDRPEDALRLSVGLIGQRPSDAAALRALVWAYGRLGRSEEAMSMLNGAIAADPEMTNLWLLRANLHRSLGRNDLAERDYGKVLSDLAPQDPEARLGMALINAIRGDYDTAGEALARLIAEMPNRPDLFYYLGQVRRQQDRIPEALEALGRALTFDPENGLALGARGSALLAAGDYAAARADLEKAYRLRPDQPWIVYSLADAQLGLDSTEAAVKLLNSQVDRSEDPGRAAADTAAFLVDRRRAALAMPFLKQAADRGTAHAQWLSTLVIAHHQLGDFEAVVGLDGRPEDLNLDARAVMADSLRMIGRYNEAITWAQGALESVNDPGQRLAPASLGRLLHALGRYVEAIPLLKAAMEEAGNPGPVMQAELADALLSHGGSDEALPYATAAAAQLPDNPWVVAIHGAALRTLGHDEEALEVLGRSLQLAPDVSWVQAERVIALLELAREEALAAAEAYLRNFPDDALALACHGWALLENYRPTAAIDAFDASASRGTVAGVALSHAGAMILVGRYDEAAEVLRRLLDEGLVEAPDEDALTRARLGECYIRREPPNARRAIEALAPAADRSVGYLYGCILRGNAHLLLGQRNAAEEAFTEAIRQAYSIGRPDAPDVLNIVGWANLKLGRARDAVHLFTRALDCRRDPWLQFDIGLATLHTKPERARTQYLRAVSLLEEFPDARMQQTIVAEAAQDVQRALGPEGSLVRTQYVSDVEGILTTAMAHLLSDGGAEPPHPKPSPEDSAGDSHLTAVEPSA